MHEKGSTHNMSEYTRTGSPVGKFLCFYGVCMSLTAED